MKSPKRGFTKHLRTFILLALAASTVDLSAQVGGDVTLPERPPVPGSGPFGSVAGPEGTDFQDRAIIRGERLLRVEDNIGYGEGRTVVEYNEFQLEADRMVIDFTSGDIQAEGNVLFRSPNEFIKATSGRFNLTINEGVAYGVDGQSGDFYFRAVWDEDEKGPSFRQIDEKTSIFRGSHVTTNPFPVPMYYIKASEIIFIKGERVYFRNPVLVVRNRPVLWLPFYSRSLAEGSPWYNQFGWNSDLGGYFKLGYRYIHRVRTPNWQDPSKYDTRSHGLADTELDLFSDRGIGLGTRYQYNFDYYRHTGSLELYGIRDTDRDVVGEKGETDRWAYRHKHHSALTESLRFQLDIDQASDPDVYTDFRDPFAPSSLFERGRLFERYIRAAVTFHRDDYIARIAVEERERLARDAYLDPSDPFSDDLDFEPDLTFLEPIETRPDFDDNGIPSDRFATVRRNAYGRFATRLNNIGGTGLYYQFESNVFDSRDAGLNRFDPEDDTRVRGIDGRGAVTHRLRLTSRTTWTNTIGVGAAYYERDNDRLVDPEKFAMGQQAMADFVEAGGTDPGWVYVDNTRFQDEETIFLGPPYAQEDGTIIAGPTTRSLSDVNNEYLFADYLSRLNHRFTDFLDGYLQYKIRKGTDDSLGEFYESIGMVEAKEDIYDFYTDEHWLEGGLNFFLRYPNIRMNLMARQNIQTGDDIYPNELLRLVRLGTSYANSTNEFQVDSGLEYQQRQIRDREDPNEFQQESVGGNIRLSYFPRHARYWAQLLVSGNHKLQEDPVERSVAQRRRFDEDETEFIITPTLGRQFGPKYRVQVSASYNTRYEDFDNAGVTIIRDLHDAELGLFLGVRNDSIEARKDEDDDPEDTVPSDDKADRDTRYEYDIRASIRFKINRDQPGLGRRSITTLADLRREGQYVE